MANGYYIKKNGVWNLLTNVSVIEKVEGEGILPQPKYTTDWEPPESHETLNLNDSISLSHSFTITEG